MVKDEFEYTVTDVYEFQGSLVVEVNMSMVNKK